MKLAGPPLVQVAIRPLLTMCPGSLPEHLADLWEETWHQLDHRRKMTLLLLPLEILVVYHGWEALTLTRGEHLPGLMERLGPTRTGPLASLAILTGHIMRRIV